MDDDAPTGRGTGPRAAASSAGGRSVLAAAETATEWLAAHRDAINALNVFPVPDGDTGTNMLLTMRSAVDEGRRAVEGGAGAGEVAARIAHGALLGARGNSGVILSQVIRGFADAIAGRVEIDGRDIARGFAGARDLAYKAVLRPVEGTMLTVVRVAAERAETAALRSTALPSILAAAVHGARQALASTPNLLEILRQAGVVDAGGQGIVRLLEGMERYARGGAAAAAAVVAAPAIGERAPANGGGSAFAGLALLDRAEPGHGDGAYGYCTNFVVHGEAIDVDQARADLGGMGDSAVIVGDARLLKVHVHTANPGRALEYGLRLGELDQIKIDNMGVQTRALATNGGRVSEGAENLPAPSPSSAPGSLDAERSPLAPASSLAVVAVAAGAGLAAALRSMGAGGVVGGGQTMNPSTEELVASVEGSPAAAVILLPNNPNILLTAGQVSALATKPVGVVPSRSVPQGLAALAAFQPEETLPTNLARMTAALAGVRTVELTRAVRDATVDGVRVAAGQPIGLLDDRLVAAGDDATAVAMAALAEAGLGDAELVTVFRGVEATADEVAALRDSLLAAHPHLTVEMHDGGQPHYPLVIAVE